MSHTFFSLTVRPSLRPRATKSNPLAGLTPERIARLKIGPALSRSVYFDFWIEHGIGRRVCALIDSIRQMKPTLLAFGQPLREQVDRLLPGIVCVGVAEAARLEQALTAQ